jgi:NADH-quinone oxidoreductase subunit E
MNTSSLLFLAFGYVLGGALIAWGIRGLLMERRAVASPVLPQVRVSAALPPTSTPVAVSVPDDLRRIRGVGRKIERSLLEYGIVSYMQIAAWGPQDVDRFLQAYPRLRGRVHLGEWTKAARALQRESGRGAGG